MEPETKQDDPPDAVVSTPVRPRDFVPSWDVARRKLVSSRRVMVKGCHSSFQIRLFSDSTTVKSVLDVRRRLTAGLSVTVTKSHCHFIQISIKFNLTIGPILVGDVLERNYSQLLCPSKPRLLFEYRVLPRDPPPVPRLSCVACRNCSGSPLTTLPGMATK